MEVLSGAFKKDSADQGKHGVADPAVFPRHGAWHNRPAASGHSAAHDEIVAIAEFFDKRADLGEVVAIIGVAHDHPASVGGFDSVAQGVAVAFLGDANHAGAGAFGEFDRAVGAPVIGDEHFALEAEIGEGFFGFEDAALESFRLVEAGHEDSEVEVFGIHYGETVAGLGEGIGERVS